MQIILQIRSLFLLQLQEEPCFTHLTVTWTKSPLVPNLQDKSVWTEALLTTLNKPQTYLDKPISEVKVVALDRERHAELFKEVREAGAQLHLMGDGDVSAAIWAARPDGPYDMLLGIGAAQKE